MRRLRWRTVAFDEDADRKKDAMNRSFEDELEASDKKSPSGTGC
jgi:hypothetical protein